MQKKNNVSRLCFCCGKVSQNFRFKKKLTNTNQTSNKQALNRNRAKPML